MDYNSNRTKMPLPEYGRNIQNMVDHVMSIEDRNERIKAAQTVIDVMGNLNPHLRDIADFKHKLWDHLAIMADFKLDIDYPYDPPSPALLESKPNQIPYNQNYVKYKHYGLTLQMMIKEAINFEDGEKKELLISLLANHMKKSYLLWNKDSVADEKIIDDLRNLSLGKINKDGMQLAEIKVSQPRSRPKKHSGGGHRNYKRN